jgi:hypothetical protein
MEIVMKLDPSFFNSYYASVLCFNPQNIGDAKYLEICKDYEKKSLEYAEKHVDAAKKSGNVILYYSMTTDEHEYQVAGATADYVTALWYAGKKDKAKKEAMFKAFKDTSNIKDSAALQKAFKAEVNKQAWKKYRADHKQPWNKHTGKPIAKGEFSRWTDISTSRWDTFVENLFGESLQLHQDQLLGDTLRSRSVIVPYRSIWNYVAEGLLVLLFLAGIWFGRRSRFLWMALAGFLFDMLLHMGLGFGINEVYIMTAHWVFVIPIAIGYLFKKLEEQEHTAPLLIGRGLGVGLSLFLFIWNTALYVQFFFL